MVSQTQGWAKTKLKREPGTLAELIKLSVLTARQFTSQCVFVCAYILYILPCIRRDSLPVNRTLKCLQVFSFTAALLT